MRRRAAARIVIGSIALAVASAGTAVAGHATFSDTSGSTHEAGIHWLAGAGVSGGCGDGKFCPEDAVKRGQLATLLHRLSGTASTPPSVNADKVDGLDAEQLRGQTGPAGPAGPAGPVGRAGPAGPEGPAGTAASGQFSTDFLDYGVTFNVGCADTTDWRLIKGCTGRETFPGFVQYFDASQFPVGTQFYLDLAVTASNSGMGCVRLVDSGAHSPVEGSQACQSEGGSLIRSGPFALPAGNTSYVLEGRAETVTDFVPSGGTCYQGTRGSCFVDLEFASLTAIVPRTTS